MDNHIPTEFKEAVIKTHETYPSIFSSYISSICLKVFAHASLEALFFPMVSFLILRHSVVQ